MSALHAARATVGLAWCLAASCVVLSLEHPVVLAALLAGVLGAGAAAGAGRQLRIGVLYGVPFAVVIALVNALVSRDGVTVLLRGGDLPWIGQLDITLEALAYGGILGLRALVTVLIFAVYSAAVDADELMRAFRRVSFRTALTAALATRMMPVLARDARRMADAQRCRPTPAPRLGVLRAVTAGALDRATDVAATLEVRGYGGVHRPARSRRAWSRHDLGFAASAAALIAVRLAGSASFEAYPVTRAGLEAGMWLTAAALVAVLLAPFADRRGIVTGAAHPHAWRPPC